MLSQQKIRETNLKRIFHIILTEKGISRAQIAHKTKLTKTTVSSLVDELIEKHFVEETEASEPQVKIGRKPIQLKPDSAHSVIIVISWRAHTILFTILSVSSFSRLRSYINPAIILIIDKAMDIKIILFCFLSNDLYISISHLYISYFVKP